MLWFCPLALLPRLHLSEGAAGCVTSAAAIDPLQSDSYPQSCAALHLGLRAHTRPPARPPACANSPTHTHTPATQRTLHCDSVFASQVENGIFPRSHIWMDGAGRRGSLHNWPSNTRHLRTSPAFFLLPPLPFPSTLAPVEASRRQSRRGVIKTRKCDTCFIPHSARTFCPRKKPGAYGGFMRSV